MTHKLFTVIEWDSVEYGAFMGVYDTPVRAYRAACIAANSVTMFVDDQPFTAVDLAARLLADGDQCIMKGENERQARVMLTLVDQIPPTNVVYPIFEMIFEGLRKYIGTFTNAQDSHVAATRATQSVILLDVEIPFSADDLKSHMAQKKENIILTGENELMAIIMYAPLNYNFITTD